MHLRQTIDQKVRFFLVLVITRHDFLFLVKSVQRCFLSDTILFYDSMIAYACTTISTKIQPLSFYNAFV